MASDNFRTLAFALRNVNGLDTYGVLNAADAVERTVEGLVAQGVEDYRRDNPSVRNEFGVLSGIPQVFINLAACTVTEALEEYNKSRKINAIKAVRLMGGEGNLIGLKAAKDAVESEVFRVAALRHLDTQWEDYNERMSNYCCTDCNGEAPVRPDVEPLAAWERELLSGDAEDAAARF